MFSFCLLVFFSPFLTWFTFFVLSSDFFFTNTFRINKLLILFFYYHRNTSISMDNTIELLVVFFEANMFLKQDHAYLKEGLVKRLWPPSQNQVISEIRIKSRKKKTLITKPDNISKNKIKTIMSNNHIFINCKCKDHIHTCYLLNFLIFRAPTLI